MALRAAGDEMRAFNQFLSAFSIIFGALADFRLEKILWRVLAYAVEAFSPIPRWLLLGPEQRKGACHFEKVVSL
jgi:hypothetical protein